MGTGERQDKNSEKDSGKEEPSTSPGALPVTKLATMSTLKLMDPSIRECLINSITVEQEESSTSILKLLE